VAGKEGGEETYDIEEVLVVTGHVGGLGCQSSIGQTEE